jgi:16S rRNA (uracil1498-N3)-methyltransferase
VARRIHVDHVRVGEVALDAAQAHHARNVLRLADGARVDVFDDAGAAGVGRLVVRGAGDVAVIVETVEHAAGFAGSGVAFEWAVASAVPKGERSDWMVEKLSELGAAAFVPLAAARSVVLPEGRNKRERWERIATESAKQSRRIGVMRVAPLTPIGHAIADASGGKAEGPARGWYLSTQGDAMPVADAADRWADAAANAAEGAALLTLFVGPEGGWAPQELERFAAARLTAVALTSTILRVETAAVAAAAVVATLIVPRLAARRD